MRLTVEEAVQKYRDRLYAAAFSVCRDPADADDAVQDTFIKYYSLPKEFEDEEHLRAWLMRVTINRARDILRSFWRRNRVSWEDALDGLVFESPEDGRLFGAVMALPETYRVVIHLFYYEEYSVCQIARLTRRREGTVKSQLSRGRALLKKTLKEEWDDDE